MGAFKVSEVLRALGWLKEIGSEEELLVLVVWGFPNV